jgi:hypothetical protein
MSKNAQKPTEARLEALEKGLAALAIDVAALKRQRTAPAGPPAIRSRGPKAQMTDEAWLAQRRKLAEHARAVAAKKAAKKSRKR